MLCFVVVILPQCRQCNSERYRYNRLEANYNIIIIYLYSVSGWLNFHTAMNVGPTVDQRRYCHPDVGQTLGPMATLDSFAVYVAIGAMSMKQPWRIWVNHMATNHNEAGANHVRDFHYSDVIMGAMASQITSLTIVYSTVYSGADQRKHRSSALMAFVRGIHRWPVNSPHKWPVTQEMIPFDDVIILSATILA